MAAMSSRKRSQCQMLDQYVFLPPLNSTFIDFEGKECAKIIHDLVFQRYGGQWKLYRSKRLKLLREMFYPDVVDESYPNAESIIDFQDVIRINNDHNQDMKEIISKVNSESTEHGLTSSQTFCDVEKEDERLKVHEATKHDVFLNDSTKICLRRMNLTYTQSVGSEDISDLLSDQSTYFSNTKSPSKSINDDNNNTVMDEIEESNESVEKYRQNLQNNINAQELAIQEFRRVLEFGRRKRGFAGSIPHIQAEKGLLVANLRKQVITATLNNEFHWSATQEGNLTGKITINNVKCDTNVIGGHNRGSSPCYYLCTVQHKSIVLCTDILAPDMHGIVEFPSKFILENISNTFNIKLSLFKLQFKPTTNNMGWRKSLGKRQVELPKLVLVGNQEVSIANIHRTAFSCDDDEILYANFTVWVHMPHKKEGTLTLQKIVRKTKTNTKLVSHRRWCVLEGTDLKVFRCRQDVDYCEPIEVISLVYCKSCSPHYSTPTTIMLNFVHAYFGRTLYLPFDNIETFRYWLKHINMAIDTARSFGL